MPSPSKLVLVCSLFATGGIMYGGAWFASGMTSAEAAQDAGGITRELPLLAPVPGLLSEAKEETEPSPGTLQSSANVTIAVPNTHNVSRTSTSDQSNSPSASQALKVTISGVKHSEGKVLIIVFDNQLAYDSYDYEHAVGYSELKAAEGSLSITFDDLVSGPYAITAFHDENGNYDLDMKDGYPVEGYGISGARSAYDEPSFQEASVEPGMTTILMHYLQ